MWFWWVEYNADPLDRATKRPRFQSNLNIIKPKKFVIVLKGF